MQNFDASAASQGQQWFQDSRRLMQDWSANAASQMMPGAAAPQAMAGAPIMLGPGAMLADEDKIKIDKRKSRDGGHILPARPLRPMPFGGYRAKGGRVRPGTAYVVGEESPELFVPDRPGQIVPMGQLPVQRAAPLRDTGSAMDRHMSTGLSGMPTRPVGRSMSDPSRMNDIAMRRMRSQGDYQGAARLATNQQWLDARFGGRNAGMPASAMMPGAMPPSMPQPPPMQPGGRLVPGRSAGSMVWQPDAPPPMAPATEPMPTPMAPPMRPPEQPAADAMPVPDLTINPLTGLPFALATPNVPSGFMAQQAQAQNATFPGLDPALPGLYTEAPPPFRITQIGQMDVITDSSGKQVGSYKREAPAQPLTLVPLPNTNIMVPRGEGSDRIPLMENRGTIESPRPSADTMGPMPGMMDLRPLDQTPSAPRGPQVQRIRLKDGSEVDAVWNAQTNEFEPVAMAGGSATGAGTGSTTGAAGTSPLDKLRALRGRAGREM